MSKRKFDLTEELQEAASKKKQTPEGHIEKHTLDSDEEEDLDHEILNADDIEGEEDGISRQDEGVRMTAFNMKEEMEEGHFDTQGHFIWNNEKEVRDNWLDNIDWHKIKNDPNAKHQLGAQEEGLGAESDSEPEGDKFDEIKHYKDLIKYMKPGETVNKAISRLGGGKKLSSVERLKRKKAGTLNTNEDVTALTEIANNILTNMGNMDVYQESYDFIENKIRKSEKATKMETDLDMYSDDFDSKEKQKITTVPTPQDDDPPKDNEQKWEFKWEQDSNEIQGPHSTKQMDKWVKDGYFKTGVWVRKHGEDSFYSSNRIDFELYM